MKYAFLVLIVLFATMYTIAVSTLETQGDPHRTTIFWSTDPNPARVKQVATFAEAGVLFSEDGLTSALGLDQARTGVL